MTSPSPRHPEWETLPDRDYARRVGKALAAGLLAAMTTGLVVFAQPIAESGKLPGVPAIPLAVSLPLFVAVVLVVTVWLGIRMARPLCPRCGRVVRADYRRPQPPLKNYSYVCEHCRVRWLTNVKPDD